MKSEIIFSFIFLTLILLSGTVSANPIAYDPIMNEGPFIFFMTFILTILVESLVLGICLRKEKISSIFALIGGLILINCLTYPVTQFFSWISAALVQEPCFFYGFLLLEIIPITIEYLFINSLFRKFENKLLKKFKGKEVFGIILLANVFSFIIGVQAISRMI